MIYHIYIYNVTWNAPEIPQANRLVKRHQHTEKKRGTQNGLPYLEPLGRKPGSIATGSQAAMLQVS
jgi:hypothetical protein